jgi:hypothetical protein
VPKEPSINAKIITSHNKKRYPLDDAEEERKLTGMLAFLSAIEDDLTTSQRYVSNSIDQNRSSCC